MKQEQTGREDESFGRMTDPSGEAFVRGICSDEMEFYLVIEDNRIARFWQ